ncbi:MAG TPA: helix-turn-helix domain-containing protein [Gemmatimonadales bacterium]|nr:helix-turn-helix domain-containing protein [Gemmatimonadales bacterium]
MAGRHQRPLDSSPVTAFGPWSYLLSFGALNGAAVALLLLRSRTNRSANRLLAALLLVVVLRLVPYIIGYAGYYDAYPWLSFAPFDLPLAIGPLLWLYVVRLTSDALPPRWQLHLAPALLHLVGYGLVFVWCSVAQKTWIAQHLVDPWVAPAITVGALVGLAVYGWKALSHLRGYRRWLDGHLSNGEEFRLEWLGVLLALFAGTGLVWLGFAAADAVRSLSYYDEFPFYLFQAAVAWVLGLLAMRHAATVYPIPSPADDDPPDVAEPVAPPSAGPDWRGLGERYVAAIRANRWAHDPQLTLAGLAGKLGTNTTYVSRALNLGLGQSFNDCINAIRVEAVVAELDAGSNLDLVQIGFDAGFNSKASFQRAFRRHMQTTPSAYREAQGTKAGR